MSTETTDVRPNFDVHGELPTGTVVLEASAGTGKTFTIAALATRYVAEGVADLSRLMLVTFGRAATAELRDRVRSRLVSAELELRGPDPAASDDDLVRHLADAVPDELDRRRDRLTRALADFDGATIATTHGFCQQMLAGLGMGADGDADAVFVPDIADLVDEVVDDVYLQRYAAGGPGDLPVATARAVARAAVSDQHADLVPADAPPDSAAGHRVAFARDVQAEVLRRKRTRQIMDYDDLLLQLHSALTDPVSGPAAVERVRASYDVVLVDEFQDTDPVQWEILERAFHGHRTLVLIGDPKQAIYAFRGADVTTYLRATRAADSRATLGRNWRSDEPLLAGLERVFAGAALGHDDIVVQHVESAHQGRRLTGAAPVRLRVAPREVVGSSRRTHAPVAEIRSVVARDVAADVVRQLSGPVRLRDESGERALEPGDIAVITTTNAQALAVRDALAASGVPAVQSGFTSVFGTAAAKEWLTLLLALEQPSRSPRVGAAALTPFLGWDAQRLATGSDLDRDGLAGRVREWAHVLSDRGVAALVEVMTAAGLTERLLRTPSGERTMTDLRHVGQALHQAATAGELGLSATVDWLRTRIEDASTDYAEDRSRRLESDAAAVQVITVHASKGLEYPVTYVPFGWDRWEPTTPDPLKLHDATGARLLDVGGSGGPGYAARLPAHQEEDRGEDLRLLYVALTRAQSQVVLWWAPSNNSKSSSLSRMLFAGSFPGMTPGPSVTVPSDADAWSRLLPLAERSGGTIALEAVATVVDRVWTPPAGTSASLTAARFTRRLDSAWQRLSYTALTRSVHEARTPGVTSEPEAAGTDDEVDVDAGLVAPSGPAGAKGLPSPMADLPGGAAFGTLVHGVLEEVDTSAPDLAEELRRHCRAATSARTTGVDPVALAEALEPVMRTPMGPLAAGRSLAAFAGSDRLSEMEFELPLAGGDASDRVSATLAGVAAVLRRHLPADDPLAGYAPLLEAEPLGEQRLRGYLTGSLDAVLRVGSGVDVSYVVADYKTNWLGPLDEPLTTWQYRPEALVTAMLDAHYPLQLLLYLVALHRFLRWRQPGYDPDRHLGGGLYLFVRGMAGPATPTVDDVPAGVFGWRPPTAVVVELSALLDGERS